MTYNDYPEISVKRRPTVLGVLFFLFLAGGAAGALWVWAAARVPDGEKAGERMVLTIQGVEYPFRWCPAGTFLMGSPEGETGRKFDEKRHEVTLSHGFWMLETPVTQAMWESMMRKNPSYFPGGNRPVETVSWEDCQEYVKKLNSLRAAPAGYRFSLPTEAQWEYACRAGTTTAFHFGGEWNRGEQEETAEVGTPPANAWGLHDMHGNVWEWCLDSLDDYPDGSVTDPAGSADGAFRVIRGGGWLDAAANCRSANRSYLEPTEHHISGSGLRIILIRE